jgi:membrane fusion protein (multidrug efflux system)
LKQARIFLFFCGRRLALRSADPNLKALMRTAFAALGVALATGTLIAFLSLQSDGEPARTPASTPSAKPALRQLTVQVESLTPAPLELTVPATGSLRARESVELVSELNRRLVRVRAVEGAKVKKGEVLFELDVADVRAELDRLAVQARLAEVTLARQNKLVAEGLSTSAEQESAQAKVDELQAERRLREVTLAKAVIRAPFAGTIGLRRVSQGAWVSPSTPLVTLHDTHTLKLDFTLPERYAGLLHQGQRFRFTVEGRAGQETGRVLAFEPAIDASSRSVVVRAEVDNVNDLLPGTFARIELPLRLEQALLAPAIAVVPGPDGRRVFVEQDGVARARPVEVGERTADRIQILSGVKAGDRVIVSNLLQLKDGGRVRIDAAGASR